MENYKGQFKEQYNSSIEYYNKGDYEHYFFHVRKSIELFGKFLIFDLLNIKGEADKSVGIISGTLWIDLDFRNSTCQIINARQPGAPEGSLFVTLAKNAVYYVYPSLLNPGNARVLKRAKIKVDSGFNELIDYYNTSSEISNHTGDSQLDPKKQADSCAHFFCKFFNDLKQQISEDAYLFLGQLDSPLKSQVQEDSKVEEALIQSNDFSILDSLTNFFERSIDDYYIAILPEKLCGGNGSVLGTDQLQDLYRVGWQFIVDFNQKTSDGLYEKTPDSKKSSIRIITDNLSEVTGSSNLTNWMFAKGRKDLGGFDEKAALKNAPKMFCRTFSKLVKTGLTKDYVIFDFGDTDSKLTEKFYDKLEVVFDDWDSAANRCKIICFTKNLEYRAQLKEWSEYTGVKVDFLGISFEDFVRHLASTKSDSPLQETNRLLLRGNSLDITEAKERYHAAGIDFYCPSKEGPVSQWDFYSGAEITWEELENQCDVQRDVYRIVRSKVTDLIKTIRKTAIFTLQHRPGSGATTLARRLGFDITKDDGLGLISCTVVDIKHCSNLKITDQYLCQLSEKTENTPILAIVESKHVGRDKFDYLVKRMSDAGKKILFFYVEPFTSAYHTPKENVVLLESLLRPNELKRFEEKYKQLGIDMNLVESQKKLKISLEVIDFPLMLKDNETSANLVSYVKEWMDVLPENLKKFCAFVGFAFKYSDLGVNQTLLKTIWKDSIHYSLMSYDKNVSLVSLNIC